MKAHAAPAIDRIPLLDGLAQLDTTWLEAALRAGGHDMQIHGFTIEPIGAGNVSDTARIVLDAVGEGPRSVVAKFRPVSEELHGHGVGSGAYRCEAGAYRLFASREDGCRIPRIFCLLGQDDNINILMEDLSRTTRSGDQIAGCTIADADAVITELARLHRGYWPLTDAAAPCWLLRMPACGDYWAPVTEAGAAIAADRYRDQLPDAFVEAVRRAGPLSRAWHDLTHSAMTVTHGDPRADNVLFEDKPGGPQAILIDWQVTGLRNPMHDIGYLLSSSVAPGDRRAHERALLDHYADEFGRTKGYTSGAMIDDYRVQLVSGLMTVLAATALLPDDARANRLLLALLNRTCSAVIDWQSLDALRSQG